jgi:hypothetical protein
MALQQSKIALFAMFFVFPKAKGSDVEQGAVDRQ